VVPGHKLAAAVDADADADADALAPAALKRSFIAARSSSVNVSGALLGTPLVDRLRARLR
jgi:hypothetical protein